VQPPIRGHRLGRLSVAIAEWMGWLDIVRGEVVDAFLAQRAPRHERDRPNAVPIRRALRPSARLVFMVVLAGLPSVSVALAARGWSQIVSSLVALMCTFLVPMTFVYPGVKKLVPFIAALLLLLSLLSLPFNSASFVVDFWTTNLVLVATLPRRRRMQNADSLAPEHDTDGIAASNPLSQGATKVRD